MSLRFACARLGCAVAIVASLGAIVSAPAHGAVIVFDTPTGATTGGQPIDAQVTFTTSANTVQIVLQNDKADPVSAVQCLSGIQFHLSTGETTGSLTSSSGILRAIIGNGTYTDSGPASTGWLYQIVTGDIKINALGGPAPKNTIVGPPNGSNVYASGNPSVTGGSHNPHIGLSATFTLNVPGVTAASTVTSAVFQFNTAAGNTVNGQLIPEPGSLAAGCIAALGLLRRRSR